MCVDDVIARPRTGDHQAVFMEWHEALLLLLHDRRQLAVTSGKRDVIDQTGRQRHLCIPQTSLTTFNRTPFCDHQLTQRCPSLAEPKAYGRWEEIGVSITVIADGSPTQALPPRMP